MRTRSIVATLLIAPLMASASLERAAAQPRTSGYNEGYNDGYRQGFSDGSNRSRFDDRAPPPESADMRWRREYRQPYTYRDDIYYRECRTKVDPGGVIAGALIGGLLGNALGGGNNRGVSTLAGVIMGGAVGAALTRDLDCEDRSYAYNTYYNGLNGGRAGVPYQWRNPRNGHYGEFRVRDYYNDRSGFRCANFTQQIFINGRPQAATGRACRQPDGTWAIVG